MNRYDIYDVNSGETIMDILPTPRLLDEGTRNRVEAYRESEWTEKNSPDKYPGGIWRVREDSYDAPRNVTPEQYRNVIVLVKEDDYGF